MTSARRRGHQPIVNRKSSERAEDPHAILGRLSSAFPAHFPFYHLGTVELADETTAPQAFDSFHDMRAIGYALHEERAALILLFDQGLDPSTYSEMGNIIASRLSSAISPPRNMEPGRVAALVRSADLVETRTYFHTHGGITVTVHALLLTAPSEGAAYA